VRNLIVLLFLGTLAWYGYGKFKERSPGPEAQVADLARRAQPAADAPAPARATEAQRFTCDGRTHCSQMRSCTEATYFIQADVRPLGLTDGESFARTLPHDAGVVGIPTVVFCDDPDVGRPYVRFAFCKRDDVLDEAVGRLLGYAARRHR
jgi:aspartate/methionine/tyrosine aminotransferase